MKLTGNGIAYEAGDRIQANLNVSFRYRCQTGTIIEVSDRGHLVSFDNTELNPLWLKPKHFD